MHSHTCSDILGYQFTDIQKKEREEENEQVTQHYKKKTQEKDKRRN